MFYKFDQFCLFFMYKVTVNRLVTDMSSMYQLVKKLQKILHSMTLTAIIALECLETVINLITTAVNEVTTPFSSSAQFLAPNVELEVLLATIPLMPFASVTAVTTFLFS